MGTFSTRWRLRMATFSVPEKCRRVLLMVVLRSGYTNPTGPVFQIRLGRNRAKSLSMVNRCRGSW
jgi:hypothetical protein